MFLIDRNTMLWNYLTDDIKGLIVDGEELLEYVDQGKNKFKITDFSFVVFPFAKAYEGFLKKFFFDLGMISYDEYFGDEIRIGRILNPKYIQDHGNIFNRLCKELVTGEDLSEELWETWKRGRNRVFHYFPHNFRRLNYEECMDIIRSIVSGMEMAVKECKIPQDAVNTIK